MHSTSAPAAVRLRTAAYNAWVAREKLGSEGEQAERIGISRTQLNRVKRGEIAPGERFIAALLTATGIAFEELFEVIQ
jgi:transcriptional regulator with XRE-family HTH domain